MHKLDIQGRATVNLLSFHKSLFLLSLFGTFLILPNTAVGVSVTILRDMAILGLMFMWLLVGGGQQKPSEQTTIWGITSLFVVVVAMAATNSSHISLVAPLYIRLFLYIASVSILASHPLSRGMKIDLFRYVYASLAAYILLSLITYIFPFGRTATGAMEGFAGQHFSKFVFVTSTLFYLMVVMRSPRDRKANQLQDILLLGLSLLSLALVLQRGALIAVAVGFLIYRKRILPNGSAWSRALFWSLLASVFAMVVTSERFLSYAFFDRFGPRQILHHVLNGTFSWDMIRARGRFEMAEAITANADIGILGNGPGVAKYIVGSEFFLGREPHNDMLMLLTDVGVLGSILVLLILLLPALLRRRIQLPPNSYSEILYVTGASSLLGFVCWMAVSNVLVYLPANFLASSLLILAGKSHLPVKNPRLV